MLKKGLRQPAKQGSTFREEGVMGPQTRDYILLLAVGATAGSFFVKLIDKSLLRVKSNSKDKPRVLKIREAYK